MVSEVDCQGEKNKDLPMGGRIYLIDLVFSILFIKIKYYIY